MPKNYEEPWLRDKKHGDDVFDRDNTFWKSEWGKRRLDQHMNPIMNEEENF